MVHSFVEKYLNLLIVGWLVGFYGMSILLGLFKAEVSDFFKPVIWLQVINPI